MLLTRRADPATEQGAKNTLLRRVADHVRAVSFAIADGARPDNKGAGYIVRRLIRRATLDIDKLGVHESHLFEIVEAVVRAMGEAYPEVAHRQEQAELLLKKEEDQFRKTLRRGLDLLERELAKYKAGDTFDGEQALTSMPPMVSTGNHRRNSQ